MRWAVLFLGLDSVAVIALLDCLNRPEGQFEGGAADKRGWSRWMWIAAATGWVGVGYGIVLGYYYAVVKRNTMSGT